MKVSNKIFHSPVPNPKILDKVRVVPDATVKERAEFKFDFMCKARFAK